MRFDTSLTRYEDLDFWLRAAADRGVVWSTTPELVAYHRVTPGSLTSNGAATLRDGARVLTEHLEGDTLHAATAKLALSYATSDVLAGADFDAAIASVRSCARGDGIDPDSAAECARFAAIYRLGIDPTRSHGPWITRTRAWWRHLAEAGLASTSLPRDAMRSLARAIIDPRRVARVLLAGIDPDRGMTIVGLGTNGRVLADEAIRIGMPFDVRDDRGSSVLSAALGGTVRVDPVDAPVSRCETLIITPLDDDGIVARFPASVNARRWNHAVDSLMSTRTDPAFTGAA
jgi:hypothetical protein